MGQFPTSPQAGHMASPSATGIRGDEDRYTLVEGAEAQQQTRKKG